MDHTRLVDWSPVLHLMITGALLALGPLCWVWLRARGLSSARRMQQLTLLTLFLTFDLVLFGAFTRLTDSGLGCPDWPGCYGHASPVGAQASIHQAQTQMPTGPVTHEKAWIEMIHRYLATAVGVLILTQALFVLASRWRRASHGQGSDPLPDLTWPLITLVWVCLQGAFGALTVTMKLFPAIVTLHLLGGLGLLVLLARQVADQRLGAGMMVALPMSVGLRAWTWLALILLIIQILLGGWVSTNYAVLACQTFPMCQNSWWPAMNFEQGFSLWRPLGLTAQGNPIAFEALTAIHYTHRLFAYGVFAVLGLLAWRWWRQGLVSTARWLGALLAWQLLTGLSNVMLDWPLLAAVAHTGGSAALLLCLTWTLFTTHARVTTAPSTNFTRPTA